MLDIVDIVLSLTMQTLLYIIYLNCDILSMLELCICKLQQKLPCSVTQAVQNCGN